MTASPVPIDLLREVVAEDDHDPEGFCSLCGKKSERAVRIKLVGQTGGGVQAMPHDARSMNLDRTGEPIPEGVFYYYRFGTCCLGKMIHAMERG